MAGVFGGGLERTEDGTSGHHDSPSNSEIMFCATMFLGGTRKKQIPC